MGSHRPKQWRLGMPFASHFLVPIPGLVLPARGCNWFAGEFYLVILWKKTNKLSPETVRWHMKPGFLAFFLKVISMGKSGKGGWAFLAQVSATSYSWAMTTPGIFFKQVCGLRYQGPFTLTGYVHPACFTPTSHLPDPVGICGCGKDTLPVHQILFPFLPHHTTLPILPCNQVWSHDWALANRMGV